MENIHDPGTPLMIFVVIRSISTPSEVNKMTVTSGWENSLLSLMPSPSVSGQPLNSASPAILGQSSLESSTPSPSTAREAAGRDPTTTGTSAARTPRPSSCKPRRRSRHGSLRRRRRRRSARPPTSAASTRRWCSGSPETGPSSFSPRSGRPSPSASRQPSARRRRTRTPFR